MPKFTLPHDQQGHLMSALKSLGTLIAAVNQSLDADMIIHDALDEIMGLFQCHAAHIRLLDHTTNEMVVTAQRGYSADELAHLARRRKSGEGLTAIPMKSGEVFISEDINADPRYGTRNGFAHRIGTRSFLYFPLHAKGKIVGDIVVHYKTPRTYSPEEIQLFIAIGHLIGTAIENARSYREKVEEIAERRQAEEALQQSEEAAGRLARENELIAEIGRIIGSTPNIAEVYERFAAKVREAIPFDRIVVSTVNRKENTRTVRYRSGCLVPDNYVGKVFPVAGTRTEPVVLTKSSLLTTGMDGDDVIKKFPASLFQFGARSTTMVVPLISKDEVMGVLTFQSAAIDSYAENDLRLAERVGAQIAGAIANAQLFLERQQAEEALRESEKEFRLLAEAMPQIVWASRKDGWNIYFNQQWVDYTGLTLAESYGHGWNTPFHPDDQLRAWNAWESATKTGGAYSLECRLRRRDGVYRWWLIRGVPLFDETGEIIKWFGTYTDIDNMKQAEGERRILEERLNRSEKMEALGTLAGGVAHDMNNVLGVLSGYSELLQEGLPEGGPLKSYANKILAASEKGAAIIQDLLTLARRGVPVSEVVNINRIAADFFKSPLYDRIQAYHPDVQFMTDLSPDLLNIKGSPVHLEKTVMNLVLNAAESITDRGTVMMRTENRYLDQPVHGYEQIREGDYVVLAVSDTGGGIPSADLDKIFEPFYTKKMMGRSGTGLGLAIVWGTVKDHAGYIDVESIAGHGSTFTLYFPATREDLSADQKKMPVEQYLGRGETILVVDDVSEQRDVATSILNRLGYAVHAVSSGEAAVAYLRSNHADLVVLDMIMVPGIDGLETYERIISFQPGQKAVIVSGFSETQRVQKAQALGAGAYVKKPYLKEKIGMAVRQELDRKKPGS